MPMLPWLMRNKGGFMPEVMTRQPQPQPAGPGNFTPEVLTRQPQEQQAPPETGGLLGGGGLTPEIGMLLAMGAGLLRNRNKRIGEGLGEGAMNAMNTYVGLKGNQRQDMLNEKKDKQAQREVDQAEARAASLEKAIAGLPPDQQDIARANPDEFFRHKAEQMFKAPEAPKPPQTRSVIQGGEEVTQEWDGTGWKEIGRGGRWAPQQPGQGTESWSLVPPEEAEQLGFAKGSVVSRSSRGNYQVEQSPKSQGMTVETNPDGTMRLVMGGSGAADPVTTREGVSKARAANVTFQTADDALAALDARIADKGMSVLPGAEQQETGTIYRLAINELRKLTESGALQKADLDYLQSIIQDPTALGAAPQAVGNVLGTGSAVTGTRAQIQAARDYLKNVRDRTNEVYAPGGGNAPEAPKRRVYNPTTGDLE